MPVLHCGRDGQGRLDFHSVTAPDSHAIAQVGRLHNRYQRRPIHGLPATFRLDQATVSQAGSFLLRLKEAPTCPISFIPDGRDVSHLPGWVKTPKQITDGHLSDLAKANGALLATLADNIDGSYLIPK